MAAQLRAWRKRAGLTQAELAERSGVGTAFIGKLEQGRQAPGVRTANSIAWALGLSPAEADQLLAAAVPNVSTT